MTIESNTASREILERHINGKSGKNKGTVESIIAEGRIMKDFVLKLGAGRQVTFAPFSDGPTPVVNMVIQNGEVHQYGVHPHALGQIAEKFAISQGRATAGFSGYIRTMVESGSPWKTELASHMINEHVINGARQRVLVREVGGTVKGVLSESYKRMDTLQIFESFYKAAGENGCQLIDAHQSDLKSYLEVIKPEIVQIPFMKDGHLENFDVVFGARIANSDYGAGSLEMRNFFMQVKCMNGMVGETLIKAIHLGSRLPDNIEFSSDTYKKDTIAQASKVKDVVNYLMSTDAVKRQAMLITDAVKSEMDYEKEFKSLVKTGKMGKGETEAVVEILTSNNPEHGVDFQGSNLWKFTQGITAYANTVDEARKRDLHELAGELLKRVETPLTMLAKAS